MTRGVDPFLFNLPTRIRFGVGSHREVAGITAAHGHRVALVVGRSAADATAVRETVAELEATLEIVCRRTVHGEPDDVAVVALAAELRDAAPDAVVAIGGGSVLDLVKAAAHLPTPDRLAALLGGERVMAGGIPVVALPTTAGSGAEVSHGSIVLDRGSGRKRGIRGPGVAACDAIVDPELMRGAPPGVIAAAGFDALAHAVETAASRASSDLTLQLAAAALPRILEGVPAAWRDPEDVDALAGAAYGALLMGVNLANSSTCLPHRLQYPVGAATGTAHAMGVAALFPAWLARTIRVAPSALARLARAARLADETATDADAARTLAERIRRHLDETAMRGTLADLGIGREDVPDLVARVEGTLTNDPGPVGPDDLRDLYLASLEDDPWMR